MRVEQVTAGVGRRGLIKMWEPSGFPFEAQAMEQIRNIAKMPFIHKHVAVMPDAHKGTGATVGTVIATKGAVIPAAVGVDIGCGMMAVRLDIKSSQLPDNLFAARSAIEAAVPHGRSPKEDIFKGIDVGSWDEDAVPESINARFGIKERSGFLRDGLHSIVSKHPKLEKDAKRARRHLGTLGTGNHFIEITEDQDGYVWVMLHSGSRGIGNAIGSYFIDKAKEEMRRYHILEHLPHEDLAYLVEHTDIYDDYMEAVDWAQEFAVENRKAMMHSVLNALRTVFPGFTITEQAVECHHNYVTKEQHFGANVLVTRKGAVQARAGTMGIIPGSMGVGSFIVRGKGNKDSFCSCSHGAGRTMSRIKARENITLDEHRAAMVGIESRMDESILDESPAAYKPLGAVMDAQTDLVEPVFRLMPLLNVKG